MNDFLKSIKAEKLYDYTPDYDFNPWGGQDAIPVLMGNYYWTGAYIYYFPDVSNLDVRAWGYQTVNDEPCFWYGSDNKAWRTATPQQLTDAFIKMINSGVTFEPLTSNEYCNPYIQHGTNYNMDDSIPTTSSIITSVSISPATASATVGTAFSQQYNTACEEGDDGSYSYLWSASGSVAGLSLSDATSASPILSGVPAMAGNAYLTVTVTDSYGNKATDETAITIADAAPVFNHLTGVIASINNTTATVGAAYTGTVTATPTPSDDGSYTYSYSGSANGLTVNATGVISGTPTASGDVTFTATVTDSYNTSKSATATVTIEDAAPVEPATLKSASAEQVTGKVGSVFDAPIVFDLDEDDDGTYTYTFTTINGNSTGGGYVYGSVNGALTTGVAYPSQTFKISTYPEGGNPTKAGSPSIQLTIKDTYNNSKPVTVPVTITA